MSGEDEVEETSYSIRGPDGFRTEPLKSGSVATWQKEMDRILVAERKPCPPSPERRQLFVTQSRRIIRFSPRLSSHCPTSPCAAGGPLAVAGLNRRSIHAKHTLGLRLSVGTSVKYRIGFRWHVERVMFSMYLG